MLDKWEESQRKRFPLLWGRLPKQSSISQPTTHPIVYWCIVSFRIHSRRRGTAETLNVNWVRFL
jgi:hypothetical protein